MLSACWLIGAYFLAVSSHKRGRLNTSVYGMHDDAYLKVFTLNSRFFDALLKVPLFGVGNPAYYMGL